MGDGKLCCIDIIAKQLEAYELQTPVLFVCTLFDADWTKD